ncbi:MAG: hypothetical protein BVN35_08435 [Proteobacteria bacterium ST_bin11]|nr:MAG: hypothetical protein BVN35_08435 [Proteobacteria bacterium ST_bin11]
MSGLGPTAEILSFASPKESIQRKGDPDAAYALRFSLLARVFGRAILGPPKTSGIPAAPPIGLISPKAAMLGAAYGRKTVLNFKLDCRSGCAIAFPDILGFNCHVTAIAAT